MNINEILFIKLVTDEYYIEFWFLYSKKNVNSLGKM